jgi:protein SCO1/2
MARHTALSILVLSALAVLAGCGGSPSGPGSASPLAQQSSRFSGTELSPAEPAPDFALRDQNGTLVRLTALRGKFVFVTFLYTRCPDTCPLIAENLDAMLERLGPKATGVRVLAVSVDPKRDTPAAARTFVRQHRLAREFHFLLGTRRQLAKVWRAYHVAAQAGPEQTVDHSAYTLLVDRDGKSRVLYDAQIRPGAAVHDLRELGV